MTKSHSEETNQVEAKTIIITGNLSQPEQDSDLNTQRAIDILSRVARDDPGYLLDAIQDAVQVRMDGMVSIAIAILVCKAPEAFLKDELTRLDIIEILRTFKPPRLLEFVELVKSKIFGRGFGSRIQKSVRSVMEGWTSEVLPSLLSKHSSAVYSLVRIVHPRYYGSRGKLIQEALDLN